MKTTQEFQERVGRIDGLVQMLEASADPVLRGAARELMESLMAIHGAALERVLEIVEAAAETGPGLVQTLAGDELIGGLLVLYGLHPEDFPARVRRGLDTVGPLLRSHGVRLDEIAINGNTVRVQIPGGGSAVLEVAIRDAVLQTAPDATDIVIEHQASAALGFVPLSSLKTVNGSPVAMGKSD